MDGGVFGSGHSLHAKSSGAGLPVDGKLTPAWLVGALVAERRRVCAGTDGPVKSGDWVPDADAEAGPVEGKW